jgi:hypothetical protein
MDKVCGLRLVLCVINYKVFFFSVYYVYFWELFLLVSFMIVAHDLSRLTVGLWNLETENSLSLD